MNDIQENLIIPPGETLLEEIEERGMTQKELAQRLGLSDRVVNQIINGKAPITPETARKLEIILGIDSYIWMNLENRYRLELLELKEYKELEKEKGVAKGYMSCYPTLVSYNFVNPAEKIEDKIIELRKFFAVGSLLAIDEIPNYNAIFRRTNGKAVNKHSLAAWLRIGEIEAARINVDIYNKSKLNKAAERLSKMTNTQASDYSTQIKTLCAEAGVKVVYTPKLTSDYANGAVRWIGDNPVLQISLRGTYLDIFWFTLMHEIGHLLMHSKKNHYVEIEGMKDGQFEKEADKYAQDILIDEKSYRQFVSEGDYNRSSILNFAYTHKIHPSILAGRLAKDDSISNFTFKEANPYRVQLKLR